MKSLIQEVHQRRSSIINEHRTRNQLARRKQTANSCRILYALRFVTLLLQRSFPFFLFHVNVCTIAIDPTKPQHEQENIARISAWTAEVEDPFLSTFFTRTSGASTVAPNLRGSHGFIDFAPYPCDASGQEADFRYELGTSRKGVGDS